MDHLKVNPPALALPEVPYLHDDRFVYDGLGLANFPERLGFDYLEPPGENHDWERSSFLQSWLYFGTLAEIFDIYRIPFDISDFTKVTDGRKSTVYSGLLTEYLAAWVVREKTETVDRCDLNHPRELFSEPFCAHADSQKAALRFRRIHEALQNVCFVLKRLDSKSKYVVEAVWDSIVVLGTTLQNTARCLFDYTSGPAIGVEFRWSLPFNRIPCRALSQCFDNGLWYPRERRIVAELMDANPAALFVLAQMDRRQEATRHRACNSELCHAFQIDEATYVTQHTEDCDRSTCHSVGFDPAEHPYRITETAYKSWLPQVPTKFRSLPVWTFREENINVVRVSLASADSAALLQLDPKQGRIFVAISHVWADGLGNPRENKLPSCQLSRLQGLVDELFDEALRPVPFWIDTLCIPLEKAARMKEIGRMEHVYKSCSKVLVLDADLQRVSSEDMTWVEKSARIICSSWSRRLWTLQEGGVQSRVEYRLADNCCRGFDIQLSNRTLDLSTTHPTVPDDHYLHSILPFRRAADADAVIINGDMAVRALNPMWENFDGYFTDINRHALVGPSGAMILGRHMRSIMFRTCSKLEDGSLVFSSIAHFTAGATGALVHVPPDQRYKKVFESLSWIPSGIIFLDQRRYDEDGSRWIPRSLLSQSSQACRPVFRYEPQKVSSRNFGTGDIPGVAYREKEGLRTKLNGFDLLPRPMTLPAKFRVVLHSTWYSAFVHRAGSTEPVSVTGDLAIIPEHYIKYTPSSCYAVVVTVASRKERKTRDKYLHPLTGLKARYEALVELRRLLDPGDADNASPLVGNEPCPLVSSTNGLWLIG